MLTTFCYQFCRYTLISPETFAYMDQTFMAEDGTQGETTRTILTDNSFSPSAYSAIIPDGSKYSDGVTITHDSKTACTADRNY